MTTRLVSLLVLLLPWVAFATNTLNFDGSDDYVQTPLTATLIGSTFTIEAWVNASDLNDRPIVSTLTTSGNTGMELHLAANGSLSLTVRNSNNSWSDFNTQAAWISGNTWVHVAATFDGTAVALYVNGYSCSVTGTMSGSFVAGTELLEIGRRVSGDTKYKGDISEVQLWNVVRSQAEIQADLKSYATSQTNQLAYYKMDQGMAGGDNAGITTSTDLVNSANNGTLNNFALSGTGSNWVLGRAVSQVSAPPSGTGSSADPYQIDSLPNLLWLSTNNTVWSAGNEFRLMKDIDASDTKNWNSDSGFSPIGDNAYSFDGIFHGNGKVISGLTIHRPGSDSLGFFGRVGATGAVDSLGLQGSTVLGRTTMGALFGSNQGTITHSFVTSSAVTSADSVQLNIGLFGGRNTGSISNSYASGVVSATGLKSGIQAVAGGFLANNSGTVSKCYTMGSVTASSIGSNADAGGIAAFNSGVISLCFSMDTLTATASTSFAIAGGITAWNSSNGKISNSYATGPIHTNGESNAAGGIAGITQSTSSIDSSYAVGLLTSSGSTNYIGGLTGYSMGGTLNAVYWDTQTTGQKNGFGMGTDPSTGGLSTAEMMTSASFSNLDLTNIWMIYESHTYPLLREFMTPTIITAIDTTKIYDGNAFADGNGVHGSIAAMDSLIKGTPNYSGSSQGATDAGDYTISVDGLWSTQLGYLITDYADGVLHITARPITISGVTASDKVYDGTTDATLSGGVFVDTIVGDALTLVKGTGAFGNKNAGTSKSVTASGYSIEGADATNYTLSAQPTGLTADITPYPITVTADTMSKTIGDTDPVFTYTATSLFDDDSFTGVLTRETGDTAGTYSILQGTLSAGKNYKITYVGADFEITEPPTIINPIAAPAYTGRVQTTIFNLQGQLVWSGILNVTEGRFTLPESIGAGRWVVKMRMGHSTKILNQLVQ